MSAHPTRDTLPEAEKVQIDLFRGMDPAERLQRGIELSGTCRRLMREGVRSRHPEYDDRQLKLAVIRLTLTEELFLAAYPEAVDIIP